METKHSSTVKKGVADGKKLPTVPQVYMIVFASKVEFDKYSALLSKDREEERLDHERISSQFEWFTTDSALAASLSN
jgi:hypothetical protein